MQKGVEVHEPDVTPLSERSGVRCRGGSRRLDHDPENVRDAELIMLTTSSGFAGIDGVFRFRADGTNVSATIAVKWAENFAVGDFEFSAFAKQFPVS
jgi:hypothetical protein